MNILIVISILILPLIGGLLSFALKRPIYSLIGVGLSFVGALYGLLTAAKLFQSFEWLAGYELSIRLDSMAFLLIALVLFISFLVHLFSQEYMNKEEGKHRYFAKLGFFTFSMVGLLMADHLILLFVFWELVGLASYLLIGFWYQKSEVPSSARMAFMVNRIADVSLLIGILILHASEAVEISKMDSTWLFLPSMLVAVGAFGKSAQLPFSGWLTKAMVGPTPVSALIHAATMVAAGVYLLVRLAPFLHPQVLIVIAWIGSLTALFGGISALFQNDIKKVLAYSTISQLGYMVIGIGVGGEGASLFHLFTHAFFKAGLFLGAGAIIHFMHHATDQDAQDMRNMGGLRKQLPWTFRAFLICSLALAGLPFFSGFLSKEAIILSAWNWAEGVGKWAYLIPDIALITAFITAFYVGRMLLLVFFGEPRINLKEGFLEAINLKVPLIILALGSIWVFYQWNPLGHESWLNEVVASNAHQQGSWIVTFLSIVLVLAGLSLSYGLFKPGTPYPLNYANQEPRYSLGLNGFYLAHLYGLIGKGVAIVGNIVDRFDRNVIDGFVHLIGVGSVVFSKTVALVDRFVVDGPVNGIAYISGYLGKRFAALSSRDAQTQLAWLLIGVLLLLSWILFF